MRKTYKILVTKPKNEIIFEEHRRKWEDRNETDLK